MKAIILAFAAIVLAANVVKADVVTNYLYPYQDPYLATLTVSIMKDTHPVQTFVMPALPGRHNIPLFEKRDGSLVVMMKQKGPAPVIFVIPGVGGLSQDASAQYLSEMLFDAGYTTVTVDSPFSWKFALSQSQDAVPGMIPNDSRELYAYLQKVKAALPAQGVEATNYSVIGYSLGAINIGFMQLQDRQEHKINFRRSIMINPPLDLEHALNALDALTSTVALLPPGQFDNIMGAAIQAAGGALQQDISSPAYFANLHQRFPLSPLQEQAVLGGNFRNTLADVIFTSQQIVDRGLLTVPASEYQRNAREAQAVSISFNQYVDRLVMPYWQTKLGTNFDRASFIRQGSLAAFVDQLANDPAVYLLHNADDFLDVNADALQFSQLMGDRASIYPYGGHCGNIWFSANRARIQQIVKDAQSAQ